MAKEKMTVAAAMVKALEQEGIKHIFGYPGAAICPFFDEIIKSDIQNILVRHEANSGHAACGYARVTGKPAVCAATSGPGATNLITAVATAHMDSIPMIAVTGQVVSNQIGRDAFQEADITGACEPFVKHSYLVKNAEDIGEIIKKAFYIAGTGRPGPVLIDVPMDIQKQEIEFEYPETVEIRSYKPSVAGNKLQVKKAAEALKNSVRPLICAGGGILTAGACGMLRELSEKCDIPVIATMMGIGSIPTDHKNYYGMLGVFGVRTAKLALAECDLLMVLGARMSDRSVTALEAFSDTTVIHIDVDPAEIGKNSPVNIPIVGDVKTVLEQFMGELDSMKHEEWQDMLYRSKLMNEENAMLNSFKSALVSPKPFVKALCRALPSKCVICSDVGSNQIWAANNIELTEEGRFITSGGMGTMGYALPAAVGAKTADDTAEVVALCGDGSFQMSFMELATAVQHNINVKVVVFVNNFLGMVREYQDNNFGGRRTMVDLSGSPDFLKIAEAYGIDGETLTSNEQTEEAVQRMVSAKKPYLLQVMVDMNERSLIE
ncbi:MAG: biosynthetic-type acetolactate synthase large subunit [Bacteroides sp.]|nr:biosynthetic-type acetolactate synthase large subunit [Bacteroides sp.]